MKTIVVPEAGLATDDPRTLVEQEAPVPEPGPRDLRVRVEAVSVNPVDTKVRRRTPTVPRQLGFDAAGIVDAVGAEVTLFKPGDAVFYAGSITRPGTNAELHLVDERIVGHRPKSLDAAAAAAIPLTAITAWELLFDRLGVPEGGGANQSLLVVGAAGGVGSMLVQIARRLTRLTVIGTASRPETADWVRELGAHHVVDHSKPLADELKAAGLAPVDLVASLTQTGSHYAQLVEALRPQGRLGLIDDPATLDAMPLKTKAISLHWELMFTRPMFETDDMVRQHELLERVAQLVDDGVLRTTANENFGRITADNLRKAHALVESGKAKGKVVLAGW